MSEARDIERAAMVIMENTRLLRTVVAELREAADRLDFTTERLRQERLALDELQYHHPYVEAPDRHSDPDGAGG